jgi:hypothetical protein
VRSFTIFSLTARVLHIVNPITIDPHKRARIFLYNAPMDTKSSLSLVSSNTYDRLLPLVPDEPWASAARAALLTGHATTYADDAVHPTVVATGTMTPEGQALFLFGDADNPMLAAFVRAQVGPARLVAADPIRARLPEWRPDATPRQRATFTPPSSGADAAFAVLPPGGVRRLRPADARHLAAFPAWLWAAYGSPDVMLCEGIAYARYLRAELVALACIAGSTERYDAIAAYTFERTRRNGFARECAQRLIGAIVNERGRAPVLTTDAANEAALSLAQSLGMTDRADQIVYDLA